MADWIDKELKEAVGHHCAVCGKVIEESAFSVVHCGGSFADASAGEEEITKIYICSSECRHMHVGEFWRRVFPVQ